MNDYQTFFSGDLKDPYPLYHQLRSEDPVHWSDVVESWIVTRYENVASVLQFSPELSSNRILSLFQLLSSNIQEQTKPLYHHLREEMQYKDPPEHTRLRKLVNKAFTPRMIAALRPRLEQVLNEMFQDLLKQGRMDFIRDFAYPFPVIVICELLGLPPEDRDQFKHWSDDITAFLEALSEDYSEVAERAQASVLALQSYLSQLVAQRRQHPKDDLITALASAVEEGEKLSEKELHAMIVFLLFAGHETTTGLLGNGLLALLKHPEQLQRIRENRSLISSAVEECLRYDGSIQRISRLATQDFEMGGKQIQQGQRVWGMIGAANRDPLKFSEPDRFDVARQDNRHLAFGTGIHFCIGAPLARLEGEMAFNLLLDKMADIQLQEDVAPWRKGISLRILESLPITFRPK